MGELDRLLQNAQIGMGRGGTYGNRFQSMQPKRSGYFGELIRPDGNISGELSFDFDHRGQNITAPLLVPTLAHDEIEHLLGGGRPTASIYQKARGHALTRMAVGKDPFAKEGELYPLPVRGEVGGP